MVDALNSHILLNFTCYLTQIYEFLAYKYPARINAEVHNQISKANEFKSAVICQVTFLDRSLMAFIFEISIHHNLVNVPPTLLLTSRLYLSIYLSHYLSLSLSF